MAPVLPDVAALTALYRVRKGAFEIVDVPDLGFLVVTGRGSPEGAEFTTAVQALYAVSFGVHVRAKKEHGDVPGVMPLEALWWVDDEAQRRILDAVVAGEATMADTERTAWHWQAMIVQPPPVDADLVGSSLAEAVRHTGLDALGRLRYERWTEGRCAQVLHVGPYAAEVASLVRLHEGIAAAGYRPRGRHHEIYLSEPRRTSPEHLRTILRQPVEPVD